MESNLRFIERDGKRILQERIKTENRTETFEGTEITTRWVWADVPLVRGE